MNLFKPAYRYALALLVMLLFVIPVLAIEIPIDGSPTFIQTSGSNAGLNIGDYYTNVNGEPIAANRFHRVEVNVPCEWITPANANRPISFSIFDPESNQPSGFDLDEVRGANDDTFFTLTAPGGNVVGPITFNAGGGTDELWVEIATFLPASPGFGCGSYTLVTTTSDDDDNAWRLRVGQDPDCTVVGVNPCAGIGASQSALLGNNNFTNDLDGIAGTGDELVVSFTRLSFQVLMTDCQDFFFFIDGSVNPVTLNNFDMDNNISVTYFPPDGSTVNGAVSGLTGWNNGTAGASPVRGGDVVAVPADRVGWWRSEVCVRPNNQYIFEAEEGEPVYFEQPPSPAMTLSKTDGVTNVSSAGPRVTYVLTYANTGDGAAIGTSITDVLPPGATFVSCTDSCTGTGPVTWNLGIVPGAPNAGNTGTVSVTVDLPAAPDGTTFTNNATLSYTDLIGNDYPDVPASDTDTVVDGVIVPPPPPPPPPPSGGGSGGGSDSGSDDNDSSDAAPVGVVPTATPVPDSTRDVTIQKSVTPAFIGVGGTSQWTITARNAGPTTVNNVSITDNMPSGATIVDVSASTGSTSVNGSTVTVSIGSLAPGESVTVTITTRQDSVPSDTLQLVNNACISFDGGQQCASAAISLIDRLPQTGEVPRRNWWLWNMLLAQIVLLGVASASLRYQSRP